MSRDSAKAHYTKQPGDPDEGFITASDAQAAIDDIYDDMSAPAVIADGSVTSGKIAADAVGSAQIATGAVGSGELATDAVTSDKIADGAVSNAHVASDAAIAASKVAGTAVTQADTGTVTNGMLAGSIAKTKVAGTAITAADTGTVTGTMIAAGAVDNGNLAANAVNEAKIASGAVTTVKIADDAVTSDKIADNAVTAAQIAANAVGASELADNAVDTAAIAADAVTADKIANDTITAAELAANSVGTSELANDSVTAAKILDGTITANEIQNASITGAKLVNDTITATQIAANAVGASELADNAVDTAAIQDGAVGPSALTEIGNLLPLNVATGGDTLGATTGIEGWAGTVAYSTAWAARGAGSFLLTATGTTNASAYTSVGYGPVLGGQPISAVTTAKQSVGTRTLRALFTWYTSGGGFISQTPSEYFTVGSSATEICATATPPATTGKVMVEWQTSTGSTSDAMFLDLWGLWQGGGGQWALPGAQVTGTYGAVTDGRYVGKALIDAKGDLYAGTAADTVGRVAVGANGTVLAADSTQTAGLKWVEPSAPSGPMRVYKSGDTWGIRWSWSSTLDAVITGSFATGVNAIFNWSYMRTMLSTVTDALAYADTQGTAYHWCGDDVAPIRIGGTTVGGNHGWTTHVVTMAGHDKATADLNSVWTDGTNQYTLMAISGNDLTFCGPYTVASSVVTQVQDAPADSLTHVSGATHTTTVTTTSQTPGMLALSTAHKSQDARLDGVPLRDGITRGNVLTVAESYDILDYKTLIDTCQANVGTTYWDLRESVAGVARVSTVYRIVNGVTFVSVAVTALKKLTSSSWWGFLQSGKMETPSSHVLTHYLPGVKPISGVDYGSGVDMSTSPASTTVTTSDLLDVGVPPDRVVARLTSDGDPVVTFVMGYICDRGDVDDATRIGSTPTQLWDARDTGKSYPIAVGGSTTLDVGDRVAADGYRAYLSPTQTPGAALSAVAVDDGQGVYLVLDDAAASVLRPWPVPDAIGKDFTSVKSKNSTVHNTDRLGGDGLTVTPGTGMSYVVGRVT